MVDGSPTNGAVIRELERRMERMEQRLDWLDEHGSRNVGAIGFQVNELAANIGRVEGMVRGLGDTLDKLTGVKWQQILTLCVAVLPLYILSITILINHSH